MTTSVELGDIDTLVRKKKSTPLCLILAKGVCVCVGGGSDYTTLALYGIRILASFSEYRRADLQIGIDRDRSLSE